jgi:ribosome-associated translation inhibitor RaiA
MQVRVTTDNNITGNDRLTGQVEDIVNDVLDRFRDRITRVEVFLGDENSRAKSGQNDKRCTMEARLAGLQPVAVTEQAESLDQAMRGAAEKLEKTLDRTLGRLSDRKSRKPMGGEPAPE